MKLMCPTKRFAKLFFPFALVLLLCSVGLVAQSKKSASAKKAVASKKAVVKKSDTRAKDARKDNRKDSRKSQTVAKDSKKKKTSARDEKKDKASARSKDKKSSKNEKLTARERARERERERKDKKNSEKLTAKERARERERERKEKLDRKDPKKRAEARRAAAERKRAEEARRQAALAERRRREQAAREARARKLAFEKGLRTETAQNIENDNTEGEDLTVRRAAVNALGSRAGTVVVMEAKTGKVLTIVNQDWAVKHGFKPCSTIKLVTAVGGLNENVINEDGNIRNGSTRMNLDDALAFSNNGYFQRVGVNMGSSKMIDYAKSLGLGAPTGVNLEGETAGKLPYGNNNARIYSHGDDFEVTPLQLAVMVSAISNGGKKVVPQIPRPRVERTNFRTHLREDVNLPERSVQGVIPGMVGAAEYGTARRGVDSSLGIAGKTGSCIGKGSWVGLFASIAPVEDPKYSVVVITRGQGERGKYAAAVAGKIYQVLSPQIRRNPDTYWAKKLRKQPPADIKPTEVEAEGEDEEVAEKAEAIQDEEAPIIVGSRQNQIVAEQPAPKKAVKKIVSSKPLFPTVVVTGKHQPGSKTTRPRIVQ